MRIEALRLIAFGPFTDRVLDLSGGEGRLQVVYGPNEAGKSSALRALRQLLFGIPLRSPDNFVHPHPRMRIGARLVCDGGEVLSVVRRKGHSKTLRAEDDETVLDDGALAACLGNVDEGFFNRMFAIGHQELVEGGLELVSGGGDVGQALFAAGSGLIRLREVQQELLQAGEALFKAGGANPRINQALVELKEIRKAEKVAVLSRSAWQTHDRALRAARQRIGEVQAAWDRCNRERARLERIRSALPLMAGRSEIMGALADYADLPDLPEDFGDQRRAVETALALAEARWQQAQETIARAVAQMAELVLPEALLARADAIEGLQQALGSVNKARRDRPGLETRRRILEKEAAARLAEIGGAVDVQWARATAPTHAAVGAIQKLGERYARLTTQRETALERRRQLAARVRGLHRQGRTLAAPRDLAGLKAVLEEALQAGPLAAQAAKERAALDRLGETLAAELRRQTLWDGDLAALETLALPAAAAIDDFETRLAAVERRGEQLAAEKAATAKELARVTADLQGLDQSGAVPSEADLTAARALRDRGWVAIRRLLVGVALDDGAPDDATADDASVVDGAVDDGSAAVALMKQFAAAGDLPEAYAQSVAAADGIADRLRREAERVNRKGLWLAQQAQHQVALEGVTADLAAAEAQVAEVRAAWHELWAPAGIVPRGPKEMRAWAAAMAALREKAADWRTRGEQARRQAADLEAVRRRLAGALADAGRAAAGDAPLATLLPMAKALLAEQEKLHNERANLERELAARQGELEEAVSQCKALDDALADWKTQWGRAVAAIGLDVEDDPAVALAVIEAIRQARAKIEEADTLGKRLDGMDRDAAAFAEQVGTLTAQLAPELATEAPETAAAGLTARLAAAREERSKRQTLLEMKKQAEAARDQARETIARNQAQREALCRQADCDDPARLPAVEQRVQARDRLRAELDAIDGQLRALSAGATVTAFVADAATEDPDTLEARLIDLNEQVAALDEERSRLDQTIGTEKSELARMDGNAQAARHAEAAEHVLARLEADVRQYARLRIATAVLAGAIEQYREKHQGPLVQRAGELFARLTLGNFATIRAEYDDKGKPVLVGVRAAVGGEGAGVGNAAGGDAAAGNSEVENGAGSGDAGGSGSDSGCGSRSVCGSVSVSGRGNGSGDSSRSGSDKGSGNGGGKGCGELVRVEGMSDGTADQLYLALRLAGLEQYLQHNTPLPFVVDDILLRFDDQRATATLEILKELAQRTQVVFFTHHGHLVDLSEAVGGARVKALSG
ncbi:ATP-binding protein, partial [Desulfatitalea alkaliphila]|uniref:ATP-binding protein n=1 Tax=Desulfatitalea alkaliphila TaxID=2929485 RepID=UPI0031B7ED90